MLESKQKEMIRAAVLLNIVQHGNAKVGAVVKHIISLNPEMRKNGKEIAAIVSQYVAELEEVNKEQAESYLIEQHKDYYEKVTARQKDYKEKQRKRRRTELPDLPNAEMGKVKVRYAPEPSKKPHIGHILTFSVNGMYAKRYDGESVLRLDDTNPVTAQQEFYDSWEELLEWLGFKPTEVVMASDYMPLFYQVIESFLKRGKAYCCLCNREDLRNFRGDQKECKHRVHSKEENIQIWKQMLDAQYREGEAIVRYVGDMNSNNTAFRDPILFRIIEKEHCRLGNRFLVWPTYDFESSILEGHLGITHVLRDSNFGKMRIELQEHILRDAGFPLPQFVQYSRYNVLDCLTSGRQLRELVESGIVDSWGDPALCTFEGLKNRGIQPSIFPEIIKEVGITKGTTTIDWTMINTQNIKKIDKQAKRVYCVLDPWELYIEGEEDNKSKFVDVPYHPTNKELGTRRIEYKSGFFVSGSDAMQFVEGEEIRLKFLWNFRVDSIDKTQKIIRATQLNDEIQKGKKIIQWVSQMSQRECQIIYPISPLKYLKEYSHQLQGKDKDTIRERYHQERTKKGVIEGMMGTYIEGEILQLERIAYVRIAKEEPLILNSLSVT